MRTIVYSLALWCVIAASSTSEELAKVWRDDPYVAWKVSQDTGRPLLLFVTSDNCPYCVLMDRNTFSDGGVLAKLRGSFVAARVEAGVQPELTRQLQVHAFPTTLVVDANRRVVTAIPGYIEPREFERRLAALAR